MSTDVNIKSMNFASTPVEADVKNVLGCVGNVNLLHTLIARGYGWHMDVGSFSTPLTGGGAGTVIDLDQPEFGISVPSGYTLIPIRFDVTVLPGLQTTDSHETEILLAADVSAAWAADGTTTAATPRNMRGGTTAGCPATAFTAATADITDPVLGYELKHAALFTDVQGTAATVNLMRLNCLYEPALPPFLVGPCAVYGYWGGSIAATGFANLDFIVIASSLITGLA